MVVEFTRVVCDRKQALITYLLFDWFSAFVLKNSSPGVSVVVDMWVQYSYH